MGARVGARVSTGGLSRRDLEAHADSRAAICVRHGRGAVARDADAARRVVEEAARTLPEGTPRPDAGAGTVEAARAVSRAMTLAGMLHERIALEVGLFGIAEGKGGDRASEAGAGVPGGEARTGG